MGAELEGSMAFEKQKKTTTTKKNTGDPPKHIGDGCPIFDQQDEEWLGQEQDEADICHGDWSDVRVPNEFLAFPEHLPAGDQAFRHILFEGAHCLL